MIVLNRKEDCCGCHACETVCPKNCIAMREDAEGFLYPETDVALCIDCHLCEKVCPVIHSPERRGKSGVPAEPPSPEGAAVPPPDFCAEPRVYAARCANEELRLASASGGAFTVLAESVIRAGGVVFGARWNADFTEVVHDWTDSLDGLRVFRGSKYLQSRIGKSYVQAREFLREGRSVMFAGTPCQIAGLRRVLRGDFPRLLAVDIACHSVPSPKVWRAFWADLRERLRLASVPADVLFRKKIFDKNRRAWSCANFSVETGAPGATAFCAPLYSTPFGKGFGGGLFSRPSCHECPAKNRTSGSDLTIGDFWGVEKIYPDLKSAEGVSVVVCNTRRGNAAFEAVRGGFKILREARYAQAVPANGGLKNETRRHPKREEFFQKFNAANSCEEKAKIIRKFTKTPLPRRLRNFVFRCARFALAHTGTLPLAQKLLRNKDCYEQKNTKPVLARNRSFGADLSHVISSRSRAVLRRVWHLAEKVWRVPPPH